MAKRLPASMHTREELQALIEGRLSTGAGREELVKLATRLIVEEAVEAEARDAVGRDYYEHGAAPGQGYRNGNRSGRLKTAEGFVEYSTPQVAGRDAPFRSAIRDHLKGHTQALEDLWPEFKARAQAAYQAPSRAIARDLAAGLEADYGIEHGRAVACFRDDFEACIAHLRFPVNHRRAIRTTNLLERLFVEERRRLKIIPNGFGERAVLKLMFSAMTRAAEPWHAIRISDFERRQMAAVKRELDQEYEARIGLLTKPSADASNARISSTRPT